MFLDVRKKDREASLADVVGEVELEEEGDGARLFRSKASGYEQFHLLCTTEDSYGVVAIFASSLCVFARCALSYLQFSCLSLRSTDNIAIENFRVR